jgi:hypothetical protein
MLDDLLKQLRDSQPHYKTTLPISNKEIEYHPFKVKDQKIITLISQEKHTGMILKNLCKLLESCSNIGNAEDLYLADFEFLFLQIRAKSVEEQIKLKVDSTPPVFGTMNINEIQINQGKLKDTVSTDSGIILELSQPKVKDYFLLETINEESLIKTCIKSITINKFRYDLTLLKTQELNKILEEITVKDNKKIIEFIKNSPRLFYILNTGSDQIKLEGFLRFFT